MPRRQSRNHLMVPTGFAVEDWVRSSGVAFCQAARFCGESESFVTQASTWQARIRTYSLALRWLDGRTARGVDTDL